MAYYVVLSFENEEDALYYLGPAIDPKSVLTQIQIDLPAVKVEGVFKKPTMWCDPSSPIHKSGKFKYAFTRGTTHGWWVCSACKKPSKGWGTNMQGIIGQGVNHLAELLEEKKDVGGLFVGDEGVRRDSDDPSEGVQLPQDQAQVD